jgi:hypothetical protein
VPLESVQEQKDLTGIPRNANPGQKRGREEEIGTGTGAGKKSGLDGLERMFFECLFQVKRLVA